MHQHDHRRLERVGMPEAVLCGTKTDAHVSQIADELVASGEPRLLTRLTDAQLAALSPETRTALDYDELSRTAFVNGTLPDRAGSVAIVAAGTSDAPVAAEVARTLTFSGVNYELVVDVGRAFASARGEAEDLGTVRLDLVVGRTDRVVVA